MPQSSKISSFIAENWKWVITVLIGAGVLYSQFQYMRQDVETNKRRLQNYIELNKKQQETIHDLEIRIKILETTE